jgi:hypothetical protein
MHDKQFVTWQSEQGFTSWNAYFGDLSVLRATGIYTQPPLSNPNADRECHVLPNAIDNPSTPPGGTVRFSLVTGITGGVEGSLGTTHGGVPRFNSNPCP